MYLGCVKGFDIEDFRKMPVSFAFGVRNQALSNKDAQKNSIEKYSELSFGGWGGGLQLAAFVDSDSITQQPLNLRDIWGFSLKRFLRGLG